MRQRTHRIRVSSGNRTEAVEISHEKQDNFGIVRSRNSHRSRRYQRIADNGRKSCGAGQRVLAVPGNISSPFSLGTNRLIADGAGILTAPEDILRAMGIDEAASNMTDRDMGKDEKEVFDIVMKRGKITIDELSRESKRPPSDVSGIVAVMELKGILSYSMGKIFIAKM